MADYFQWLLVYTVRPSKEEETGNGLIRGCYEATYFVTLLFHNPSDKNGLWRQPSERGRKK